MRGAHSSDASLPLSGPSGSLQFIMSLRGKSPPPPPPPPPRPTAPASDKGKGPAIATDWPSLVLRNSQTLTLLTPLLPQHVRRTLSRDPFEDLGRALAVHHPRVRRLPYIPGSELSVVHQAALERGGAVVVVLIEYALSAEMGLRRLLEGKRGHREIQEVEGRAGQIAFARSVVGMLKSEVLANRTAILAFGSADWPLRHEIQPLELGHVLHVSVGDGTSLEAVASTLFQEPDD